MKPAPFVHHAPRTVDEAVAALAAAGGDGKVLAGGQSLSLVRSVSSGSSGRALLRSGRSRLTVQASVTEGCEDGTTEVNEYVLLYELGKGAQGEVFLAMDTRSNRMRAIKAIVEQLQRLED